MYGLNPFHTRELITSALRTCVKTATAKGFIQYYSFSTPLLSTEGIKYGISYLEERTGVYTIFTCGRLKVIRALSVFTSELPWHFL